MKKFILAALLVPFAFSATYGQEEDFDIEFGFDNLAAPQTIVIGADTVTSESIQLSTGAFEELLGNPSFTDNPGFITPATEEPGGSQVNADDAISIRFLDASQFSNVSSDLGFVNFFDATTQQITSDGQIEIVNQNDVAVLLDGDNTPAEDLLFLSNGSDGFTLSNVPGGGDNIQLGAGQIHNHLLFDLQGDTPGAFGLLFQFEADLVANGIDGGTDVTSDPVFLVLNNDLSDEQFAQALTAFGVVSVPEPTTGIVLAALSSAALLRRRRRFALMQ